MKNQNISFITIVVALGCFSLLPQTKAVSPAPDGCYPNYTTGEGCNALKFLTAGLGNTGIGWYSLFSNTDANYNTGVGAGTLALNNADSNTAVGTAALLLNTAGTKNTAVGTEALLYNDTGSFNTANGTEALLNNTTGHENTANGVQALMSNTTGFVNTANGVQALMSNITGAACTATGYLALFSNTTGVNNTANGSGTLVTNTTGGGNTASGVGALHENITGNDNTADGIGTLFNNTAGSNNVALGHSAGSNLTTGNDNIDIRNAGVAGESSTIRIGTSHNRTFIAGIRDVTTATAAIPVVISTQGQLGTMSSSRRFKNEIKPMDQTSEAIHALKPVTFQYKNDNTCTPQFGLIAEEVAEVNPDLVVHDKNGEIYTVRYDAVNAMLLNEFIKEHRRNEEQQATIAELKSELQNVRAEQRKEIETLTARLEQQSAEIQRVSDRIQLSKPAPRIAASDW